MDESSRNSNFYFLLAIFLVRTDFSKFKATEYRGLTEVADRRSRWQTQNVLKLKQIKKKQTLHKRLKAEFINCNTAANISNITITYQIYTKLEIVIFKRRKSIHLENTIYGSLSPKMVSHCTLTTFSSTTPAHQKLLISCTCDFYFKAITCEHDH